MTTTVPLFPLTTVLFPEGPLLLRVFEPRYLSMISQCLREDRGFGVVLIDAGSEVGAAEFVATGTLAEVVDWSQGADGLLGVAAEGRQRFRVERYDRQPDGLYVGEVELLDPEPRTPLPGEYRRMSVLLAELLEELGGCYDRIEKRHDDATWVGYRLAEILPLPASIKQALLELSDARRRLAALQTQLGAIGSKSA